MGGIQRSLTPTTLLFPVDFHAVRIIPNSKWQHAMLQVIPRTTAHSCSSQKQRSCVCCCCCTVLRFSSCSLWRHRRPRRRSLPPLPATSVAMGQTHHLPPTLSRRRPRVTITRRTTVAHDATGRGGRRRPPPPLVLLGNTARSAGRRSHQGRCHHRCSHSLC